MKIEKGKLYYDTKTKRIFKALEATELTKRVVTDKVAVRCINKDDFDYVHRKLNLSDTIKEWYYVYNDICISLLNKGWFLKGSALHTDQEYHIITIEEFKKFYPETVAETKPDAVNPSHYTSKGIQPIDYIEENGLNFNEGNVIKYVTRYKEKNGLEDLKKAKYYLERLIKGYGDKKQKI